MGTEQLRLDLAAGVDVVRAGAGRAAEAPELQFEEVPRDGTGAEAGALLAAGSEDDAALFAVLTAFDDEAYGGEPRFAVEPALRLPVALACAAVGLIGALAFLATRLAFSGPGVRRITPRCGVARRLRIAEQLSRRWPVLAASVLHDVEPVQTVAAGGFGWRLLGERLRTGGTGVGPRFGPGFVGTDQVSGKPAQHSVLPSLVGLSGHIGLGLSARQDLTSR